MDAQTYSRELEQARARRAATTAAGQDIGKLPSVKDPVRRQEAIESYAVFCQQYFPTSYTLPWSDYHKSAAAKIQRAVSTGGMFCFAMPRGSGKTTLCEWAVLWSILSGRSPYVVLIGASEAAAERRLRNIKSQLQHNELLHQDYPGETWPIRALENSARKAEGQRYKGRNTHIEWKAKQITLGWIPEEVALGSGARVDVSGLTGEIRGLNYTRPDGVIQRPTLAICDDPQTRESAKSPSQSETRERIVAGDIAYLAGPQQPISIVIPCTVIYEGDLAHNLLDREKHPEFQGEVSSMVETFPTSMELWDKYADLYQSELREQGTTQAATEFYIEHREAMDEGGKVSWPARYREDEVSGIQHAMNLKIRDEQAFFAECQTQPLAEVADLAPITSDQVALHQSGYKRHEVPSQCQVITSMIDVQGSLLYYVTTAWDANYSGYVIDYGTWPEQGRRYFTLSSARKTLKRTYPGDDEAVIFAGLTELIERIVGREYQRDDGATLRISRCLVDANWGGTSALVNQCLRQSRHAPVLTPSYGRGIKATHKPISQWQQSLGSRCGPEWVPTKAKGRQLVGCIYDANYWKKRAHDAIGLEVGSRGSLTIYKDTAQNHRMIADHITSEVPKRSTADTRTIYEWHKKPGQDNHLWDCVVGSMLAASLSGIQAHRPSTGGSATSPRRARRRVRRQ